MSKTPIIIWNRKRQTLEQELVYGESGVRFLYDNPIGRVIESVLARGRLPSVIYGRLQDSRRSIGKIPSFIDAYKIEMQEYEERSYSSFNDFFTRKFRPGMRPFVTDQSVMPAFAEARYYGFKEALPDQTFPVKGSQLSAQALLGDGRDTRTFERGPVLIARLCPVDYHRFHYPDDGATLRSYRLHGRYHSVNPVAINACGDVFMTNERHVSILQTKNFGKIAYIEVGAIFVGRIVQTHPEDEPFKRGDEKGLFYFGGSTVIVLGERGGWLPDDDILEQTHKRREVLIRLGDRVGHRII